jgi:hypothetical protein
MAKNLEHEQYFPLQKRLLTNSAVFGMFASIVVKKMHEDEYSQLAILPSLTPIPL